MNATATPSDTIEKLKAKLAEQQLADKLMADRIGELEKRAGEADKVVTEYSKAFESLEANHESVGNYYDSKSEMIEKVLSEHARNKIQGNIKGYDGQISRAGKDVAASKEAVTKAQEALRIEEDDHAAKVERFESLRDFQKAVEGSFKGLDGLMKEIEALDDGTNNEVMFFLITDLFGKQWTDSILGVKQLDQLPEINVAKMTELVNAAWNELDDAKVGLNDARKDLTLKQQKLDAAEVRLTELKAARREAIVAWIEANLEDLRTTIPQTTKYEKKDKTGCEQS